MPETSKREARPGEETKFILPNGTFLGASETDIIAVERESGPRTTSRRKTDEGPERRSG